VWIAYRSINNVYDCQLSQSDIDPEQIWCFKNSMSLNVHKTTIIFTRITVIINSDYKLRKKSILRSQCVKDLGVLLDCNICFHHHTDYIFSQGLKMLS
jgi:hypothetical protein